MTETPETDAPQTQPQSDDQGPGCLPAILAATALMGIIGFVVCAFSTWLLFQKRTELAVRTLRGAYIAEIEQSLLDPRSKKAVATEVETLVEDLEAGKYENWQAAGIMQRLQRLPVIQWGELQAIEAFLQKRAAGEASDGLRQISRVKRAVELGNVTSFDFQDVLQPVREADDSPRGYSLIRPLQQKQVDEVIHRARLLADRAEIPDERFDDVKIDAIVRREIERGAREGTY